MGTFFHPFFMFSVFFLCSNVVSANIFLISLLIDRFYNLNEQEYVIFCATDTRIMTPKGSHEVS